MSALSAHQVVSAAQHLHGDGLDRDYPLHRYLGVKAIEYLEGGAAAQLERLGALIAQEVS